MERDVNQRLCSNCGIRPSELGVIKKTKDSNTYKRYYKKVCKTCRKYPALGDKAKERLCRGCNKEYPTICLDVDHIDGNRRNNKYHNYQILCANCHRIKTHLCKDSGAGGKNDK